MYHELDKILRAMLDILPDIKISKKFNSLEIIIMGEIDSLDFFLIFIYFTDLVLDIGEPFLKINQKIMEIPQGRLKIFTLFLYTK